MTPSIIAFMTVVALRERFPLGLLPEAVADE